MAVSLLRIALLLNGEYNTLIFNIFISTQLNQNLDPNTLENKRWGYYLDNRFSLKIGMV